MTDTEQIKQKIDIVTLVSEYVPLKKTGANFKGVCPFHTEKTPSFVVSEDRQIWHCFGSCQDGGDIFKFLMRIENIDFPEALKILAKRAGVTLESNFSSKTTDLKEKIIQMNKLACEFYNFILTNHEIGQTARDYLKNRKITDGSIKLFSLGYSPNSWDSLNKFLLKKGYSLNDMEVAGLVSKSSSGKYFDRFRGRLMFPLCDHHGNVLGFAGRIMIQQNPNDARQEAKYINTSETPVYIKGNLLFGLNVAKDAIKKTNQAVIVEGEIDMIQSFQSGIKQTVAIKGSALTDGQVALLKRFTTNIVLALDADFAGNEAAHRGIHTADSSGFDIRVATFTQGKDPDELIKLDPNLWRQAVEKAVPFYDYIIDSAINKNDPRSAEGAKKIVSEISPYLYSIDNLIVKSHYLKKLAGKMDVEISVLENQIEKESKKIQIKQTVPISEPQKPTTIPISRQETIGRYILSLCLQSNRPQDYIILFSERLSPEDFSNPVLGAIYDHLCTFTSTVPIFSLNNFIAAIPQELVPTVDELYLCDMPVSTQDDTIVMEEITKSVWELREISLRNKIKSITQEIKLSDDEKTQELEKQFQETSSKLTKFLEEKQLILPSSISGKTGTNHR